MSRPRSKKTPPKPVATGPIDPLIPPPPPPTITREETLEFQIIALNFLAAQSAKDKSYRDYLDRTRELGEAHTKFRGHSELVKNKYGIDVGRTHSLDGHGNLIPKR